MDTTIFAVLEFERAHTRDQLEEEVGRLLKIWPALAADIVRQRGRWVYRLASPVTPSSFIDTRHVEESLIDGIASVVGELAGLGQEKGPHFGLTQLTSAREGDSALIVRVSHSVTDGEALLSLLRELATECPGDDGASEDATAKGDNDASSAEVQPSAARPTRKSGLSFFSRYITAPLWSVLGPMLVSVLPGDQHNPLHTPVKQHRASKRFVQCSLPLGDISAVGKLGSHTVTAVLLALLSGGVRQYLTELGHKPPSSMRVIVPVTLRSGSQPTANRMVSGPLCGLRRSATAPSLKPRGSPLAAQAGVASEGAEGGPALTDAVRRARSSGALHQPPPGAAGADQLHELDASASDSRADVHSEDKSPARRGHNRIGFVFLPVDLRPAPAQMRLTRASDAIFKAAAYAQVPTAVALISLLSATLPHKLFARVCHLLTTKSSGNFSTLRGPAKRLALGGIPIRRLYNTVTPSLNAWSMSAFSYAGEMTLCIMASEGAFQEPERLLSCIQAELATMTQESVSQAS